MTPRWYQTLPGQVRPPVDRIAPLEDLRRTHGLSDEQFLPVLLSCPWAIVRSQEAMLDTFRRMFPEAHDRRLWMAVLIARIEIKIRQPAPWDPPAEELHKRMENVADIMRPMTTWTQVLAYIIDMDRDGIDTDPDGIQMQTERILSA